MSDPETAMPRARNNRARFRMPAPPTPIMCTAATSSERGHAERGDASGGRRVGGPHPPPRHQVGEPRGGVGRAPRERRARHRLTPRRVVRECDDAACQPIGRELFVQVELGGARIDERARVRLLMVLGRMRIGDEDRGDPARGQLGDRSGPRPRHGDVGERQPQLDAVEEREGPDPQRHGPGRVGGNDRRGGRGRSTPGAAGPSVLQIFDRTRHDLIEMQRAQAAPEHADGEAIGVELELCARSRPVRHDRPAHRRPERGSGCRSPRCARSRRPPRALEGDADHTGEASERAVDTLGIAFCSCSTIGVRAHRAATTAGALA